MAVRAFLLAISLLFTWSWPLRYRVAENGEDSLVRPGQSYLYCLSDHIEPSAYGVSANVLPVIPPMVWSLLWRPIQPSASPLLPGAGSTLASVPRSPGRWARAARRWWSAAWPRAGPPT